MMLTQFAENIWYCDAELKLYGVELGTRMTIMDLDGNGTLFVHSPVKLSQSLRDELRTLGRVKFVVAPNKWHHLFVTDFKLAYPEAKFFCAPGLDKKRSDFQFECVICDEQKYPWNPFLQHQIVKGIPIFNEVVFFHPASRTLILTDLAIHICESKSLLTRAVLKILGSFGEFGWAKIEKVLYVRNRAAFKASIESILNWEIERILLTHGTPVEFGGKEKLRAAFL